MNSAIFDIRTFDFSSGKTYFTDANFWLSIYWPMPSPRHQTKHYSNALKELLQKNCSLRIDMLVISELINRHARLEYELAKKDNSSLSFKDYRKSNDFLPVAEEISTNIRRILRYCRVEYPMDGEIDFNSILGDFETGQYDFNDQIIVSICRKNGYILITDDYDFKTSGLQILTANSKLLN